MTLALTDTVNLANALSSHARGECPRLTAASDLPRLLAWLAWCDPDGIHTTTARAHDGLPPHTPETAWEAIAETLEEV